MGKKKAPAAPAVIAGPRTRNRGIRRVKVASLEDAPWNFRLHPDGQRAALNEIVDDLGWYGYPDVYETPDGQLRICDGHLRKVLLLQKYGPDAEIEVNVTDFDEADAKKATLTRDPLAALAEVDAEALDRLIQEAAPSGEALQKMLADLLEASSAEADSAAGDQAPEPAGPALGELEYKIIVKCLTEQHQRELLERLHAEGLDVQALII